MSKALQRRHRQPALPAMAQEEVERLLLSLPADLRARAQTIPVTFAAAPTPAMQADGIEPDTLGLFIGEEFPDSAGGGSDLPPQILLFLENLWHFVDGDPATFRREVRKTVLHELGHYLGLGEDDLEARRLD